MIKHFVAILFVIVMSFWAIKPLLSDGYFPMHDDTQIARVVVMGRALQNGQFPVRWVTGLGYGLGYPIYNFYGPLPYYFGGILNAIGVNGLMSTKIMFGTGIILAAVFMYILGTRISGIFFGIVTAILYQYAPYHAVEIYVRGAVGEMWAYAFIPLIACGLLLLKKSKIHGSIIGGIGLAATILSHTLMGYVTTIIVILVIGLWSIWKKYISKQNCEIIGYGVLIVGLSISAFFWIPAISEMHYTNVSGQVSSTSDFHDHFVCINELWDSPWGFAGSAPGCIDGMSFRLGKIYVILSALSILAFFGLYRKTDKTNLNVFIWAFPLSILSLYLMLSQSVWIWEIIPGMKYLQYPWRFLSITMLCLALISASLLRFVKSNILYFVSGLIMCGVTILIEAKLFNPQYLYSKPYSDFESRSEIDFRVSKISDEYLPPNIIKPKIVNDINQPLISSVSPINISYLTNTETDVQASIPPGAHQILFRQAYFPGWIYKINGKIVKPQIQSGLPKIDLPESQESVRFEAKFSDTPVRIAGNLLSLVSFIIILYIYVKKANS